MQKIFLTIIFSLFSGLLSSQNNTVQSFISDSSMRHASVSMCVRDAENGETIIDYNSDKSLIPASVMKLITSAVALELLGPQFIFRTTVGYTGSLNKRTGKLSGSIIIKGGGDPALGSNYFPGHYTGFMDKWVADIKLAGIKRVSGSVIADDSYFDFLPVPSKWLWEDLGNYYGAGVYGLSVYDNTSEIHLKTGTDSSVVVSEITPTRYRYDFENKLVASGNTDEGYVFATPYSLNGWLSGTVPVSQEDFILKASIADPPLLTASILSEKLATSGIYVGDEPSTFRLKKGNIPAELIPVSEITSPPLAEIIKVLNHESVNLYAENLLKELGRSFRNSGSTAAGVSVVRDFLSNAGINTEGIFIEDGSGLSPMDAINACGLVDLLIYMRNHGKYFNDYFLSLPEAGKEGTLKYYFKDPVFESRMRAKSGSMARVRCYSGYFKTVSDRNMVFSILVNNYTGPSRKIISGIEEIIREIILYK
jgi:serine-type D-Ala-D-Ala carboxypeptidase/endopeptidase (penicillin-binding protein 4)